MTDQEIIQLRGMYAERFTKEKDVLYQEYLELDRFFLDELEKNAIHRHFKLKKDMREVVREDYDPKGK